MSCLICLRNEGIHLSNEIENDWEIFLQLFKLPQQFMEDLTGNDCCSLCHVKFQFVGVINEEIGILNRKLKMFKEEMKEIFVTSFNNNQMNIENERAIRSRNKLLKELHLPIEDSEPMSDDFETVKFETHNERFNFQVAPSRILSDPLEPNHQFQFNALEDEEQLIDSSNNKCLIEVEENFDTEISNSSIPITEFESESFHFDPDEISTSSNLQTSQLISIKKEKIGKRKSNKNQPNKSKAFKSSKRKKRIDICYLCESKEAFDRSEDFEIHLQTFHPERFYSKCPTCNRILIETSKTSKANLKKHTKNVHTTNRPHQCDQCDASFKLRAHLVRHNETHDSRDVFICDHCDSTLIGERYFRYHMRKQHPEIDI